MSSTSWSRWLRDSRNFSAIMTTSNALPASTPFSVRYSNSTAKNAPIASGRRTARIGAGQP